LKHPPNEPTVHVSSAQFWDALAPHHSRIENNYFDRASVRRIARELQPPVLVVGAGQGLLVAELRNKGVRCDGVDFSPEMIRYAKNRRGLDLIRTDARALPFADGTYGTIIYATGVVDFNGDEAAIRNMLNEGTRVVREPGKIFIGFYRLSSAQEKFLQRVGLLRDNVLLHQECFRLYLLSPTQMLAWVVKRAGTGYVGAAILLLRLSVLGAFHELVMSLRMQQIFPKLDDPNRLIESASQKLPYRNEVEIRNLFERLAIPLNGLRAFPTCWIVEITVSKTGDGR
jgi:SAM-dependent methyltransferase